VAEAPGRRVPLARVVPQCAFVTPPGQPAVPAPARRPARAGLASGATARQGELELELAPGYRLRVGASGCECSPRGPSQLQVHGSLHWQAKARSEPLPLAEWHVRCHRSLAGQVRFITRPESGTMRAGHKAALATSKVSSYFNLATLEYSKCYSRANHKHRRLGGPRGCAASS
jgi:hypothetical protein